MIITISDELSSVVRSKAERVRLSVGAYVEHLILEDREWTDPEEQPLEASDPGFEYVRNAVTEALEQAERGDVMSAEHYCGAALSTVG